MSRGVGREDGEGVVVDLVHAFTVGHACDCYSSSGIRAIVGCGRSICPLRRSGVERDAAVSPLRVI